MNVSLSVVIPIHNDAQTLRACLRSLRASTQPPAEIIVVDDCSRDNPASVAVEFGATITRLSIRSGPGLARNRGAALCRGDVIVFIDTDVCVRPDVLQRMAEHFDAHPDLDAVFGSYQEGAGADNYLSWYKNFQHHFVHQRSSADAWTFWSGCGAVRRDVFLAHRGFSTSFCRAAVEDIEFGMRLFRAGGKLRLDRGIQATHLKRWSLLTVIRTDVLGRAAPWTELLLRHGSMPNDLNLGWTQRLSVVLTGLSLAAVMGGGVFLGAAFIAPAIMTLLVLLAAYWAESIRSGQIAGASLTLGGGVLLAAAITDARWLVAAVALAYALALLRIGLQHRGSRARTLLDRVAAVYAVAAIVLIATQAPWHWLSVASIGLVASIVSLNREFYVFLLTRWGYTNTLAAVPFHLIYYLSGGLGFVLGSVRHTFAPRRFA